ncbi:MAG: S41 family peptidase [Flavobacteriales bacterium]|nr:S41 family peptidase [Flavobacteriales bacterium]
MNRINPTLTLLAVAMLSMLSTEVQCQIEKSIDLQSFSSLLYHIEELYVDSVDEQKLVQDAIVGMLEELDPHSTYIPKDELKAMNEPLKGNFDGVGIQFNILKDTIMVVSPITGGPSEKVGILAGDRIVEVDQENVAGIGVKNSDVQRLLKGPKGTKVGVGVVRRGVNGILDFEITRDKIPIHSVASSYMADPTTGYIKISRFAATTIQEFRSSLAELRAQGMKNLILDLQGNGGGYLRTAIEIADEFLTDNQLIVFTEGRSFPRNETNATARGGFEQGKLAVLIDEGSASASEIVSGAIQDWDRGVIIGRRSFGKGLVQKPVGLPDGSAVRLTTQKYFTPSGRCIQKPYEEGVEAYRKEKRERLESGELTDENSLMVNDSLQYFTKINKRKVYGGGGIIPDLFIPLDTTMASDYYYEVVRKGIMNSYVLNYVNDNRKKLKNTYSTVPQFIEEFEMDEKWLSPFFQYAEKEGVEYVEEEYLIAKELFDTRMKALVARNIFDNHAFFEVINPILPAYQKALEVMKDDTFERLNLAQNK